jgi:rod shape-determining protein MreC
MNYKHSNSGLYSLLRGILFLISILLIILSKNNVSFIQSTNYSLKFLVQNFNDGINYFPAYIKNYTTTAQKIENLEKEKEQLLAKIILLEELAIKLKIAERDLEEFKIALNYKAGANISSIIIAKPIFNNFSSIHNIIYINAGSKQNVVENSLVITPNGVVGYVKTVFNSYSEVLLATDSNFKLSGYTSESKYNIILSGSLNNYLSVSVYKEQFELKEGETVYTNGFSGNFISNIPIGSVYLHNDEWRVKMFDDLSHVQFLYIIK